MIRFILQAVFAAVGLWLASLVLHGVRFTSTESLLAAAVLLGLANAIVRPIMVVLTLPLTLITLGLFLLVINGIMVELVAWLLHGFIVHGFINAMLAAIIVSIVSWIGGNLVRDERRR